MAKTISNIRVEYRARGAPKWDMRKAKQHLKSRQASAVKKRADYVRREAQKMSSFRTPSLSQLESLGHPYSKKRHPAGIDSSSIPHVSWGVHRRSGNFVRSIISYVKMTPRGPTGVVQYRPGSEGTPVDFVVTGTRIMWPRDVITKTANLDYVQKEGFEILKREMKEWVKNPFGGG